MARKGKKLVPGPKDNVEDFCKAEHCSRLENGQCPIFKREPGPEDVHMCRLNHYGDFPHPTNRLSPERHTYGPGYYAEQNERRR